MRFVVASGMAGEKLRFRIRLKDAEEEKAFLDAIRERNGNMPVLSSALLQDENDGL